MPMEDFTNEWPLCFRKVLYLTEYNHKIPWEFYEANAKLLGAK